MKWWAEGLKDNEGRLENEMMSRGAEGRKRHEWREQRAERIKRNEEASPFPSLGRLTQAPPHPHHSTVPVPIPAQHCGNFTVCGWVRQPSSSPSDLYDVLLFSSDLAWHFHVRQHLFTMKLKEYFEARRFNGGDRQSVNRSSSKALVICRRGNPIREFTHIRWQLKN